MKIKKKKYPAVIVCALAVVAGCAVPAVRLIVASASYAAEIQTLEESEAEGSGDTSEELSETMDGAEEVENFGEVAEEAAVPAAQSESTEVTVTSWEELAATVNNSSVTKITIANDITSTSGTNVDIRRAPEADWLTIDFGGHTVTRPDANHGYLAQFYGQVILANGVLAGSERFALPGMHVVGLSDIDVMAGRRSDLVIAENMTVKAPGQGIKVYGTRDKDGKNEPIRRTTLTVYGRIESRYPIEVGITDNISNSDTESDSRLLIGSGAELIGETRDNQSAGIVLFQYIDCYIGDGATVSGGAGVELYAGNLRVGTGARIIGRGINDVDINGLGSGLWIRASNSYKASVTSITIDDGAVIESVNGSAITYNVPEGVTGNLQSLTYSAGAKLISADGLPAIAGVDESLITKIPLPSQDKNNAPGDAEDKTGTENGTDQTAGAVPNSGVSATSDSEEVLTEATNSVAMVVMMVLVLTGTVALGYHGLRTS